MSRRRLHIRGRPVDFSVLYANLASENQASYTADSVSGSRKDWEWVFPDWFASESGFGWASGWGSASAWGWVLGSASVLAQSEWGSEWEEGLVWNVG